MFHGSDFRLELLVGWVVKIKINKSWQMIRDIKNSNSSIIYSLLITRAGLKGRGPGAIFTGGPL